MSREFYYVCDKCQAKVHAELQSSDRQDEALYGPPNGWCILQSHTEPPKVLGHVCGECNPLRYTARRNERTVRVSQPPSDAW